MTDEDMLKKLISEYTGDSLAGHLAAELDQISRIKRGMSTIEADEHAEIARHNAAMHMLEHKRQSQRSVCRHLKTKFHDDPAGGSDSRTTCEICGAEL